MSSRQLIPPGSNGDNLDHLLRAFFRAEMPEPWPDAPARPLAFRPARRRGLVRSRLALAASVLLLLVGQWLLAGSFPGFATPSSETAVTDPVARKNQVTEDPMMPDPMPVPMPERPGR
jgi:hypothetical protein